jgi:hypothetical protein
VGKIATDSACALLQNAIMLHAIIERGAIAGGNAEDREVAA